MRLPFASVVLATLASLSAALGQSVESFVGTLPIVGNVNGNLGSSFQTKIQLSNPLETSMTGRMAFLPAGATGLPVSSEYVLDAHQTAELDIVGDLDQTGIGALDVYIDGPAGDFCSQKPYSGGPVVSARIFNQAQDGGTSGCNEDLVTTIPGGVTGTVVTGALVGPTDVSRYRFNIGLRIMESDIGFSRVPVAVVVYDEHGAAVYNTATEYPVNSFRQVPVEEFLNGFQIGNNSSITFQTNGRIVVYGAMVDNLTNSPTIQIMEYTRVSD